MKHVPRDARAGRLVVVAGAVWCHLGLLPMGVLLARFPHPEWSLGE